MTPTPRYTAIMEIEKSTRNKIRLIHQDCLESEPGADDGVNPLKHPMPYLYIGKDLFAQLGTAAVYKLTIEPVTPEV